MATQIVMPPFTETSDEVRLIKWLKKEGDRVYKGEGLFEIETDKATFEVPAPGDGVLRKIVVADDTVTLVGTVVGWIGDPGEQVP